jgi:hypothetical protein
MKIDINMRLIVLIISFFAIEIENHALKTINAINKNIKITLINFQCFTLYLRSIIT